MSIARKILMGSSGGKKSTYVDDVFSTYLYRGNETARSINNGIDNTEGGMVWLKNRDNSAFPAYVYDTVRGVNKQLRTHSTTAETSSSNTLTAFNDNGISIGTDTMINRNNDNHVAWNFRKQKGFFDIVTYTGNGTAGRTVSHSLGCKPGMIIIKNLDSSEDWRVYHHSLGGTHNLLLNTNEAVAASTTVFNNTDPTASVFTVGTSDATNKNGDSFVAYLFAGGDTGYTSVDFDGDDYISVASSSDLTLGTGDFAIEFWAYPDNFTNRGTFYDSRPSGGNTGITIGHEATSGEIRVYMNAGHGGDIIVQSSDFNTNAWQHIAVTRDSGTVRLFIGGVLKDTASSTSRNLNNTNAVNIGYKTYTSSGYNYFDGKISNLRVVKGSAVHTSAFTPSTTPLNTITNTVLLCCNEQGATAATKTPTPITASGNPVKSSDNPFGSNPSKAYEFGAEGDQNVIKCGSYVGNSTANHEIYVGWEPQWWLVKNITDAQNWQLLDSMRGWVYDSDDEYLVPNSTTSEGTFNFGNPTPTGFNLSNASSNWQNESGKTYVYIAIRRPDGYVGKPAEAGTDVFTMAYGLGGSGWNFTAGFPVDFVFFKLYSGNGNWFTSARLIQGKQLALNNIDAGSNVSTTFFDSNTQVIKAGFYGSIYESFMFKRHGGFDVVTYKGDGSSFRTFNHSLGRTPEMMWVRGVGPNVANWYVYHKDLDNANRRDLKLENIDGQSSESTGRWNDTFPTATHFTVGVNANNNGDNYFAMLFSSVDGISKVGRYDGSNSPITITTGFQPRFLFVKRYDSNSNWTVFDTLRGWASGGDCKFEFNTPGPQNCNTDFGYPTSTGFYLTNDGDTNMSGYKFIYYAHA